jgi:hypothetical protein
MPQQLRRNLRVFVASPGDVVVERQALAKVISELNLTLSILAPETALSLELIRWETHVAPGLGDDAQAVVNEDIDDYDVFIGIMWRRFGTPTKRAGSGTHEEFQRAYARWNENRDLPVMLYFCQKPMPVPRSKEEIEQLQLAAAFYRDVSSKGLIVEYDDPNGFADLVRPHLLLALKRHFLTPADSRTSSVQLPHVAANDLGDARKALMELAREYELIRSSMPWSRERTQRMAAVFSKMRALAATSHPLIDEAIASESPGERLAAIAILLELPAVAYLDWLAQRPASESSFIGYHAALALLQAVRQFGATAGPALEAAIKTAEDNARRHSPVDPNQISVLENALRDLIAAKSGSRAPVA